jgi:hypothetical protein
MKNSTDYQALKSSLENISKNWKAKEKEFVSQNVGFGSTGYINIEMINPSVKLKKDSGCQRVYNSYNRLTWSLFHTSTNAMVDTLAEQLENQIKTLGFQDLKISVTLL